MFQICDFAYRLATTFHDFYNECYVIHKESDGNFILGFFFQIIMGNPRILLIKFSGKEVINYHRLVLCQVTADTMADCFKILGIRTVEKM